jgi:hypothetical protein
MPARVGLSTFCIQFAKPQAGHPSHYIRLPVCICLDYPLNPLMFYSLGLITQSSLKENLHARFCSMLPIQHGQGVTTFLCPP